MRIFIIFSLIMVLLGCSKPPKEREQVVFEAVCGDRVIIVYQPVNTWGIQYDKEGRKISGLQNCTAVPIGRVEKLGAEVVGHE